MNAQARMHELERELERSQREMVALRSRLAHPAEAVSFRLARITSDATTSTTTTTTTTTSTTTPAPCAIRAWNIVFIDAQFPLSVGVHKLTTIERSQATAVAAAHIVLALSVGSIVAVERVNDRWWILGHYGACLQADSPTTTTTTTSTTTPAP